MANKGNTKKTKLCLTDQLTDQPTNRPPDAHGGSANRRFAKVYKACGNACVWDVIAMGVCARNAEVVMYRVDELFLIVGVVDGRLHIQ